MNIYSKKQRWKLWLIIAASLIIGATMGYTSFLVKNIAKEEREQVRLWAEAIQKQANLVKYTNELFTKIAEEERKRMELWAEAQKRLVSAENDFDFYLNIIKANTNIPVILTNENLNIISFLNIDSVQSEYSETLSPAEKIYLQNQLEEMASLHPPIEIPYYEDQKNYLYYSDSKLFADLKNVMSDLIKSFISDVVVNAASVPVVFTDETREKVIAYGNIDSVKVKDAGYIKTVVAEMASENRPIEIDLGSGKKNYIFYHNSFILTQIKYFPLVQFIIIGLFLIIAYTLFSTARRAEQNQVWVGMSKETAHQLGTPLSSLMAWIELLKLKGVDSSLTSEVEKDIKRLETITERFSKIGSVPALEKSDIINVLRHALTYLETRVSKKVSFELKATAKELAVPLNIPLFDWVIENICKNAIDAMNGKGTITVEVSDQTQYVYVDITDTGKGIPKSQFKNVFEPGFTTKTRGWGLGLSLTKRIVENYHKGKIFVKRSEPGKGTTFRIVLNK